MAHRVPLPWRGKARERESGENIDLTPVTVEWTAQNVPKNVRGKDRHMHTWYRVEYTGLSIRGRTFVAGLLSCLFSRSLVEVSHGNVEVYVCVCVSLTFTHCTLSCPKVSELPFQPTRQTSTLCHCSLTTLALDTEPYTQLSVYMSSEWLLPRSINGERGRERERPCKRKKLTKLSPSRSQEHWTRVKWTAKSCPVRSKGGKLNKHIEY